MKHIKILSILLFSLTLYGCQTLTSLQDDFKDLTSQNLNTARIVKGKSEVLLTKPCPQIEIIDDLSSLSDFLDPKKPIKSQLISRVDLSSAQSTCKLASKSAIIDLKLIFKGKIGEKGRVKSSDKPFFSYPFFIAVTSPSGEIMAKEIFAASMTHHANQNEHIYFEKIRQIIPIKSKEMARHYKVLIGFQLTKDQLAYNRENMIKITDAIAAKAAAVKNKISLQIKK